MPSSARIVVVAFRIWRSAAALCSTAAGAFARSSCQRVHRQVGGRCHPRAVLEVRDPLGQGVEGGDEGVPRVRLALAPAVAQNLEGAAVAQDGLAQQVPDDLGRELRLDEVENPTSFGTGGHRKVAGVESRGPRSLVLRKRLSASASDQESLQMRSVDWLPRIASPTSGASRSRFLTMRGVNCSWTKLKICPDSAPGARTR